VASVREAHDARATVKTELCFVTAEDLRSQLAEYEARFGVPSDRLADAFRRDGELEETRSSWTGRRSTVPMWPRPVLSASEPPAAALPRWVRSLDDY
jgi:hypothetical protein